MNSGKASLTGVQERKPVTKRYLVIGSTDYAGVSSCTWEQAGNSNLSDYDVVVLDMSSLPVEVQAHRFTNRALINIRIGLLRLLASGGHVVVLGEPRQNLKLRLSSTDPRETPAHNYEIFPIHLVVTNESGQSITLFPSAKYSNYLNSLKTWQFHVHVTADLVNGGLQTILGNDRLVMSKSEIFMQNREEKILAAQFTFNKYSNTLLAALGGDRVEPSKLTILPKRPDAISNHIITEILAELLGKAVTVPVPSWTSDIVIPGIEKIDADIEERSKRIQLLSGEIEEFAKRKSMLLEYRKLVYAEGQSLEQIVKQCLEYLGGVVGPRKYSDEEYVLMVKGEEYIIEVKGITKSVSLAHLRQLMDYVYIAEEKTGSPIKGILIANPWRELSPGKRNGSSEPEFPDNVIRRATEAGAALLATRDLLNALIACMEGKANKEEVLAKIVSSTGRVVFN